MTVSKSPGEGPRGAVLNRHRTKVRRSLVHDGKGVFVRSGFRSAGEARFRPRSGFTAPPCLPRAEPKPSLPVRGKPRLEVRLLRTVMTRGVRAVNLVIPVRRSCLISEKTD